MKAITDISIRQGNRPVTGDALPHLQFSDNATKEMYAELAKWLFSLENVEERPTIISVRGARAAWIKDNYSNINEEVLQFGREFTHIHPPMDNEHGGSLHLSLRREDAERVIAKGWGEYHPLDSRIFSDKKFGHVLIYAPRSEEELDNIKTIIESSYKLVTNQN